MFYEQSERRVDSRPLHSSLVGQVIHMIALVTSIKLRGFQNGDRPLYLRRGGYPSDSLLRNTVRQS